MLGGSRPHMHDVRVTNESPEQCWFFNSILRSISKVDHR